MEIADSFIWGSTGARIGVPIRKWPGVNAQRSVGSVDIGEIDLEFRQDSILDRSVESPSCVYFKHPVVLRKWALKLLTPHSHKPPIPLLAKSAGFDSETTGPNLEKGTICVILETLFATKVSQLHGASASQESTIVKSVQQNI
ncbi:hypothetical protein FF38_10652 [Lucilia cuprina]|uniref:Uncharacterized protein n=1 Tax=Lucilia cuprina TaxID=7375 RepID=A0A0L0CS72_LUCCU|nr:hypothetical protein FF38_10652 [Lucilia cuprina]